MRKLLSILFVLISFASVGQTTRVLSGYDPATLRPGVIYRDTLISLPYTAGKYITGYATVGSFPDTARAAISLTNIGTTGASTYNSTTGVFNIPSYASGGGIPAGSNTQIQFNNSSAFGASSTFTYSPSVTASGLIAQGLVVNPSLTQTTRLDTLYGMYVNPSFTTTGATSRYKKLGSYFAAGLVVKSTLDTSQLEYGLQIVPNDTLSHFGISFQQKNTITPQNYFIGVRQNGDFTMSNYANILSGIEFLKYTKSTQQLTLSPIVSGSGNAWTLGNAGGIGNALFLGVTPTASNYTLINAGITILNSPTGDLYFRNNNVDKMHLFTNGNLAVGTTTDDGSKLHVPGSVAFGYVAISSVYTVLASDYTVECTSGTFTTTLPTAVGCTGREYWITNTGSGIITIGTTTSQTFINVTGNPTTLSVPQFTNYKLVSNNVNWLAYKMTN